MESTSEGFSSLFNPKNPVVCGVGFKSRGISLLGLKGTRAWGHSPVGWGGAGFGVPVAGAAPLWSLGGGMVPTAPKMWEQEWFYGFGWAGRSRFVPLRCSLPPPASFGIICSPWESLGRVNSIRAGQTLCSRAFLGASRWNSFPELPRGRCGISHGGFFMASSPGISHGGTFRGVLTRGCASR